LYSSRTVSVALPSSIDRQKKTNRRPFLSFFFTSQSQLQNRPKRSKPLLLLPNKLFFGGCPRPRFSIISNNLETVIRLTDCHLTHLSNVVRSSKSLLLLSLDDFDLLKRQVNLRRCPPIIQLVSSTQRFSGSAMLLSCPSSRRSEARFRLSPRMPKVRCLQCHL
jgi:hypothetical protein